MQQCRTPCDALCFVHYRHHAWQTCNLGCNLQAAARAAPSQRQSSNTQQQQQQQQQHAGQGSSHSGTQVAARQPGGRFGAPQSVKQPLAQQCLASLPWARQTSPQQPLARQPESPQWRLRQLPAQQAAATSSPHAQALAISAGSSLGFIQVW